MYHGTGTCPYYSAGKATRPQHVNKIIKTGAACEAEIIKTTSDMEDKWSSWQGNFNLHLVHMIIRGDVSCANGTCLERHGIYPCPCPADRVETDRHAWHGSWAAEYNPRRWIIGIMGPRSVECMPKPNTIRGIISGSRGMLYKVRHGDPYHARVRLRPRPRAAQLPPRRERTTQRQTGLYFVGIFRRVPNQQ